MKTLLLIIVLLVGAFCGDYRMPSQKQKKCIEKKIGKEETKKLIESLIKYHKTNAKATILEYILDRRPELKDVAEECLLNIKRRRRLNRRKKTVSQRLDEAFQTDMFKYFIQSISRDPKIKEKLTQDIDKGRDEGIDSCKSLFVSEKFCTMLVDKTLKNIKKYNNTLV